MAEKKLTITRGDTQDYTLTLKDSNEVAIDITGWTIMMTIKENKTDTDAQAIIQKVVNSFSNPTSGVAVITLNAADTDALDPKGYWYDIQVKTNTGKVYTILKGVFAVEYDISRNTE